MSDISTSCATTPPSTPVAARAGGVRYVDCPARIAGVVVAVAIVSAEPGEGASATLVLVAGALWLLWVQISAFLAGGYVTGRLRARITDVEQHEMEVRDAAHGLSVWAPAVVIGGALAATA